ncbi:hypothetical protein [Mycolicibacterium elephantis]|uniref:hypothetical protein n=1 Tax=Mycolicibacterium elephantis TaxID=81858 RepID=UPI000FE1C1F0|nr:hypothetical protein [Mycolicibacterium elephantis]MCV7222948.1 hypothetical protein [Mycolicibacterium elephantis]
MITPSTDNLDSETMETPRPVLRLVCSDARARAFAAWPIFGGETSEHQPPLDLAGLLRVLGFTTGEFVAFGYKLGPDGRFNSRVCDASDAAATLASLPGGADIWFGVNPTRGPARKNAGRGSTADVTRLSSLYADLDVKDGACTSTDVANAIIDDLSVIMGTGPAAITYSGSGGLHPYWPVTDGHVDGSDDIDLSHLLNRWKRLVKLVARQRGAQVDSAFDPARVLRAPGTFNHKPEATGGRAIPVTCVANGGRPLTLAEIDKRLDAHGIREIADYPRDNARKSDPDSWRFAGETCAYAQAMIRGWADPDTIQLGTGRHQWLLAQATRLYCAKFGGCITEDDFNHARDVLETTFRHLRATREPVNVVPPGELPDAFGFGLAKAATKTKDAARNELGDHDHDQPAQRSQASRLVDIALESYRLGVSTDGRPFGFHPDTPHVVMDLRGTKLGLRQAIARDYFKRFDAAPTQSAVLAAMGVLEGMALEQIPEPLHIRIAGDVSRIHIDMADPDNRVIEISGGAWRVVYESRYKFRRTELTAAMPEPKQGGDVDRLWSYLNIAAEDRPLALAIAIDALIQPGTAKPITGFTGEHGTAKSSTSKRFLSLIDPSTLDEMHGPPTDLERWLSIAGGSWAVGLDNMSNVPDWLSDAFCRASTGSGSATRTLYTNDGLSVIKFRRSVIFNGIELGGLRGDFADRLISFELHTIEKRKAEADLNAAWQTDWPVVFGGLLDLASKVHKMLPDLADTAPLPRMADFGRVLACVDHITGSTGMARYRERIRSGLRESTSTSSFIQAAIDLRYDTGKAGKTAAEILNDVNQRWPIVAMSATTPRDWPRSPRSVTSALKRNAPGLRSMGWHVDDDGARNLACVMRWTLRPPAG